MSYTSSLAGRKEMPLPLGIKRVGQLMELLKSIGGIGEELDNLMILLGERVLNPGKDEDVEINKDVYLTEIIGGG